MYDFFENGDENQEKEQKQQQYHSPARNEERNIDVKEERETRENKSATQTPVQTHHRRRGMCFY